MSFQHYFLEQKYTIDEMQILENPTLNFEQEHIKYANIGLILMPFQYIKYM